MIEAIKPEADTAHAPTGLREMLDPAERVLWQGRPRPGRPVSRRGRLFGAGCFAASLAVFLAAVWLEISRGHVPSWHLTVYALVASAAFFAYLGLRLTLLDRRRARARDARTAYAITDRRALARAGPYHAEVELGPEVVVRAAGNALIIEGAGSRLMFARLDDAPQARDILMHRIEDAT